VESILGFAQLLKVKKSGIPAILLFGFWYNWLKVVSSEITLLFSNISFLVNKNFPFGTLFTALQAEINIAIRINAVTFVKICFNGSKILIQKYIFLWLVKTK
jgi:hypothetical protein